MKSKRIIAAILAGTMALSMTACGGSGSSEPTEKDFEKAAEKLDGMTEEDFEKAVGEGGSNGSDEKQEPVDNSNKVYEPCQEILDADFTSGLVQIGDDVFKCGGYMTVGEFVEKYGDKYSIEFRNEAGKYTIGNDKYDFKQEIGLDEKRLIFSNIQDYRISIAIYIVPPKGGNTKTSIKDAIIYNIMPEVINMNSDIKDSPKFCFYPKGTSCIQPILKEELGNDNKNIILSFANEKIGATNLSTKTVNNINDFLDKNSFVDDTILVCKRTTFSTTGSDNGKYYRFISQLNEDNLYGYKPLIVSVLYNETEHDSNADKAETALYYYGFVLNDNVIFPKENAWNKSNYILDNILSINDNFVR